MFFFTPYTYFFLSIYFLLISLMFSINNLLFYWLFMEILMLLFMGISYTIFLHSYTQLMLYFLFQTLASFSILVFYILSYKYLLYTSLFLKLGMFPFFSWYINVLYRFPSFILFLASTVHKLPPMFILYLIFDSSYSTFILIFCVMTTLISSVFMLFIKDFRYLLVVSSMSNNSFMVLAVLANNAVVFYLFFSLYMVNTFMIFFSLNSLSSHPLHFSLNSLSSIMYLFFLLLNLGAFPPFPAFFTKFLIFFYCLNIYSNSTYFLMVLMVFNVILMVSYMSIFFKYIINCYTNSTNLLVY